MKTLEVNTNNEWLRVFSPIDFDGIAQEDVDLAANEFYDNLTLALESAGFTAIPARGQRRTLHGWNGANTFKHLLGPVGSFDSLTTEEIDTIQDIYHRTEQFMRREWLPVAESDCRVECLDE